MKFLKNFFAQPKHVENKESNCQYNIEREKAKSKCSEALEKAKVSCSDNSDSDVLDQETEK